jgi:acyl phosphate:glycerol-3-phosphate acyltransferase
MVEIVTSPVLLVLAALVGYLLGSVPFGMVMARLFGLGDLRAIGSGNIGATNVLRTGNKLAAFLTLVLDAGKGGIAVLLMRALLAEDAALLAGVAAFIGHLFPVWLGFKGGKGVATFLGTMLALAPLVGVAACLTWLAVAAVTRYSSLSALVAAVSGPVWAWVLGAPQAIVVCALLAALIVERHKANIARLISGTEPRIGRKGKAA